MLSRPALLILSLAATALAVPAASSAAWIPNGVPVGPADSTQHTPVIASDGGGGAYIVWEDWRSGHNTHTFAQHLTSAGELASGWSVGGLQLPIDGYRDHPVVIADGSGGAYIADDGTARFGIGGIGVDRAYHIGSDGSPAGGWLAVGVTATGDPYGIAGGEHGDYLPSMAADGAGGVYFSWTYRDRFSENVKLTRYLPDDTNPSGWWPEGTYAAKKFTFDQAPVTSCPDGLGGVYLAWSEFSAFIYVTRFTAHGEVPPGWPVRVAPNTLYQDAPGVVPDGTGGVIVAWQDRRNGAFEQTYAQRILADGTCAPGWAADGLALSATASDAGIHRDANFDASVIRYTSIAEDGAGGAFVAWTDYRDSTGTGQGDIYLQHLGGDGAITTGWPANGLALSAATGDQSLPTIAPDGGGGVFIAWQDRRSGNDYDVYAQHIQADGAIVAGWAAGGNAVSTAAGDQRTPVVVASDLTHAILAWADGRGARPNIYSGRAGPDEATATLVSLASAEASRGHVRVVWLVSGELTGAMRVYRNDGNGAWSLRSRVIPDGTRRIAYDDVDVVAGARYGYRPGWDDAGGESFAEPVWVDVPSELRFALEGARPNPPVSDLVVSFSLATSEPASIALYDITGRRVVEREVGSLGPGSHVVDLGSPSREQPGLYLIRLTQGTHSLVARTCIVR